MFAELLHSVVFVRGRRSVNLVKGDTGRSGRNINKKQPAGNGYTADDHFSTYDETHAVLVSSFLPSLFASLSSDPCHPTYLLLVSFQPRNLFSQIYWWFGYSIPLFFFGLADGSHGRCLFGPRPIRHDISFCVLPAEKK